MYYEERVKLAHKELEQAGLWTSNYNPLYVRWLRFMGCHIRPIQYSPFFRNLFVSGPILGLSWSILMALVIWIPMSLSARECLISALIMIFGGGLYNALYAEWCKRKYHLSSWEELSFEKL